MMPSTVTRPAVEERYPVKIFMVVLLTAPFWAEKADDLALCDLKADVIDRAVRAVVFDQMLDLNHLQNPFVNDAALAPSACGSLYINLIISYFVIIINVKSMPFVSCIVIFS